MLVHRRKPQFDQDDLFLFAERLRQSLRGVPLAILDAGTLDSYRLRTQYTQNVQSLCLKEVGIRQSLVPL